MDTHNYSLMDVACEHFWTGDGFVHKDDIKSFDRIKHFTRQEALEEKKVQKKNDVHLRLCK